MTSKREQLSRWTTLVADTGTTGDIGERTVIVVRI